MNEFKRILWNFDSVYRHMCRQFGLWLARNSRNNNRRTVLISPVVLDDQHGAVSALLTPENRIQICMIDLSTPHYLFFHNHISFRYTP